MQMLFTLKKFRFLFKIPKCNALIHCVILNNFSTPFLLSRVADAEFCLIENTGRLLLYCSNLILFYWWVLYKCLYNFYSLRH